MTVIIAVLLGVDVRMQECARLNQRCLCGSSSLIHRYQWIFFDEMERQHGACRGGAAFIGATHLDSDRQ
jgi:hypothetical protein